jgi:hypothetical protein
VAIDFEENRKWKIKIQRDCDSKGHPIFVAIDFDGRPLF